MTSLKRIAPETRISVPALGWYVGAHLTAITLAVPYFSWRAFIWTVILHVLAGGGITLGVHRYFSHGTFRAPPVLEWLLAFAYTWSFDRCGQGLISWVAAHKFHHAYCDRELDPHSPTHGFWHSFCGHHIFRRRDLFEFEQYKHLCPELVSKPWLVWFDKPSTVWGIQFTFIVSIWVIAGLRGTNQPFDFWLANSFVVWCVFVRYCLTQLMHSLLDTLNHGAGVFDHLPDTYGTYCNSKNNMLLWFGQLGNETWHNIHHAFPRAANNGGKWFRWDVDSLIMLLWERLGLISGCQWLTENELRKRRQRTRIKKETAREHLLAGEPAIDAVTHGVLPSATG